MWSQRWTANPGIVVNRVDSAGTKWPSQALLDCDQVHNSLTYVALGFEKDIAGHHEHLGSPATQA